METPSQPELPERVYAEAVVRSRTGASLLDTDISITSETLDRFLASEDDIAAAAQRLRDQGFEIVDQGPLSITIAAPPAVYERAFCTFLEAIDRPVLKEQGRVATATFINAVDDQAFGRIDLANTRFDTLLDGVAINEPVYYAKAQPPSPIPPPTEAEYLSVPEGLADGLNATAAHQQGITGKGVKVVIVDSGWYAHPYFAQHNYRVEVRLAPEATDASSDPIGHGTGVVANFLAIAPEADLTVVKADVAILGNLRNVNSISAFRTAINLQPAIISCSWASDQRSPRLSPYNRVLAATVAYAVHQGITVVFGAGNGHFGFPGQHPEVIAAGGVYRHLQGSLKGTLEASNYSSSFVSPVYPGRRVPDICGLVGQLPYACYIMLPVPPGSVVDQDLGTPGRDGSPSKDGTQCTDGWAAFSGTSAAAPQVAGVCALVKQVKGDLSPADIKQLLQETAIDVSGGFSHPASGGAAAHDGPDLATGFGLANVSAAGRITDTTAANKSDLFLLSSGEKMSTNRKLNFHTRDRIERTQEMKSNTPKFDEKFSGIVEEIQTLLDKKKESGEIEDIKISVSKANFYLRSTREKAINSLIKLLQSLNVNQAKKENREPTEDEIKEIQRKHVYAAKSLLKAKEHEELAAWVLICALNNSEERDDYKNNVAESAAEALGEFGIFNDENSSIDFCFSDDTISLISDVYAKVNGDNRPPQLVPTVLPLSQAEQYNNGRFAHIDVERRYNGQAKRFRCFKRESRNNDIIYSDCREIS